jgi:2-hydroxy-3-keto-5-methylthiopentenyl-1-phosphate phosphatase
MRLPEPGPVFSPDLGVDKAGVVREGLSRGIPVAFAGDGFPDLEAARLVLPELRFARRDLAAALDREGRAYRPFERWAEIARALCHRSRNRPEGEERSCGS